MRWFGGDVAWVQAAPLERLDPAVVCGGDGFTATLCAVRTDRVDVFDAEIFTAASRVTITRYGEQLARAEGEPTPDFPGHRFLAHGVALGGDRGMADAMLNGADGLVRHLAGEAPLLSNGDDGLAALLVEEASSESARLGGRRVTVITG